jgi:hypothetical protein
MRCHDGRVSSWRDRACTRVAPSGDMERSNRCGRGRGGVCTRRAACARLGAAEVVEEPLDDTGLGDEADDSHRASTATHQWIDFVDSSDQLCPGSLHRGDPCRHGGRFAGAFARSPGCALIHFGVCLAPLAASRAGIETVIASAMASRLGDLHQHASDEFSCTSS